MDVILNVVLEVEWVLTKLGETPFELLKKQYEENMIVDKWVELLNESLIYLLKR
jgi:hypothetical protein